MPRALRAILEALGVAVVGITAYLAGRVRGVACGCDDVDFGNAARCGVGP
jgi:hypothetical protein